MPEPGRDAGPGPAAPGGPLEGLRVVEFAGLGPAPFAAMMLADHGAQVVRVARRTPPGPHSPVDLLARGRRHIGLNLKEARGIAIARQLIGRADALIEGFRPGVMERLGLGPDEALRLNPRLVYGRATGWGQTGPLAHAAGHDINYTALSGALACVGPAGGPPTPVPGFIGDFGGGGLLLAFGLLAALLRARGSGVGEVVDAAVSDGAALLTTLNHGWHSTGHWSLDGGTNMGDGGAPFYNTYLCKDGKSVSIGAIEPEFYRVLRERCGFDRDADFDTPWRRERWPGLTARLRALFATRTRDEWCALLEGSDACFAPVLDLAEAPKHPHHVARGTFATVAGLVQPAPAPRFGRAAVAAPTPPLGHDGGDTRAVLAELGHEAAAIDVLLRDDVVWQA